MKLNRKLLLVLALVLSLALATGGTLAYLTDTDKDVNVMTLGNVKIVQNEQERDAEGNLVPFTPGKPALPAVGAIGLNYNSLVVGDGSYPTFSMENAIDKIVTVSNIGRSDAYVRTIIAIETPDFDPNSWTGVLLNGTQTDVAASYWTNATIDGVDYSVAVFVYKNPLKPGETSVPSLLQLCLLPEATSEYVELFGDTWEVLVLSQAVQTAGFTDPEVALDEAFGTLKGDEGVANIISWFTGNADWKEGVEIGSPGTKNPDNNPPASYTGDPDKLAELLTAAGAAGAGNTTITLTESYDLTGYDWTPISVDGYNGADVVTINGGGNIIKGLNAPLFAGGFAGGSGIVIKDLTIRDSAIVSTNTQGSGAFIECVDSMDEITLTNCHLINSTLTGSRTGGLIGWTAGYNNVNDGPVMTYVTITNCTVEGCTINAGSQSAGGFIGHSGANAWTFTTITGSSVINTGINGGEGKTGVYVGTANVGETTITGCTNEGVTGNCTAEHPLYGRFVPGSTGKLTIDGTAIE